MWHFPSDWTVIGIFFTPFLGFWLFQVYDLIALLFVVVSYVSVTFSMYRVLVCKLLGFRVFGGMRLPSACVRACLFLCACVAFYMHLCERG